MTARRKKTKYVVTVRFKGDRGRSVEVAFDSKAVADRYANRMRKGAVKGAIIRVAKRQ